MPRSFKLPQRLDAALARAADAGGFEIVRQYLETAVAADLALRTATPTSASPWPTPCAP